MRPPRPPTPVQIYGFNEDGLGRGRDQKGRSWIARGAVPGSEVALSGKCNAGIVRERLRPAPDEISAPCPAFPLCGGCQWQSMPLHRQREEKLAMLRALLAPLSSAPGAMRGAEAGLGYRSKMEFSFGTQRYLTDAEMAESVSREGRFLGLHAPGHFARLIDRDACLLMSPSMNQLFARIRADVLASPWEMWNPKDHLGVWRHLVLREGRSGLVATLHVAEAPEALLEWMEARVPDWLAAGASGLRLLLGQAAADAVGGTVLRSWGECLIRERLGAVEYQLDPDAFFQVNREGAELLCALVGELAGEGPLLLDLYCGTGALGLYLGAAFQRVIGVELHAGAVESARENAQRNGIHAEFHCGKVEAVFPTLTLESPMVVIVDPPRAGLHPDALRFVAGLPADRIVYVACKPSSLLRDGQFLKSMGWVLDHWEAVDLFPQTGHVEVAARFVRAPLNDRSIAEDPVGSPDDR
jgi:23S rRNA (uracil1939-C5)-methyltransferase